MVPLDGSVSYEYIVFLWKPEPPILRLLCIPRYPPMPTLLILLFGVTLEVHPDSLA